MGVKECNLWEMSGLANWFRSGRRWWGLVGAVFVAFAVQVGPVAANTNGPGPVMVVNEAVMVTVELDFGARVPSIAEGLAEVERRHRPEDGRGVA